MYRVAPVEFSALLWNNYVICNLGLFILACFAHRVGLATVALPISIFGDARTGSFGWWRSTMKKAAVIQARNLPGKKGGYEIGLYHSPLSALVML